MSVDTIHFVLGAVFLLVWILVWQILAQNAPRTALPPSKTGSADHVRARSGPPGEKAAGEAAAGDSTLESRRRPHFSREHHGASDLPTHTS